MLRTQESVVEAIEEVGYTLFLTKHLTWIIVGSNTSLLVSRDCVLCSPATLTTPQ